MDVTFSIVAGLGLRLFVAFVTGASSSNKLTIAVLGLWEGIVLHQLSGRSPTSNLDHLLAYGLRLAVDLLVSKNLQRIAMMVLWSVLGTFTSEALVPYATLRADVQRERDRLKERRRRHSRSVPVAVPILSTPLPPRVRAYRPPDPDQAQAYITPLLPVDPLPDSSTPIFPSERPPTPPSFFLQENTSASPSPKPVQLQLRTDDLSSRDALPVRPQSGLATILDHSPNSGSPLHVPRHLPTPPDSAQTESAAPSDGLIDISNNETYQDNYISRFDSQLYTILEVSSPEDNVTPPESGEGVDSNASVPENQDRENPEEIVEIMEPASAPLPVPNPGLRRMPSKSSNLLEWLSSQPPKTKPEPIFSNTFAITPETTHHLPVQLRHQPLFQIETPTDVIDAAKDHIIGRASDQDAHSLEDSGSDELRTPGAHRGMDVETDNERDHDPLLTPTQPARLDHLEQQLSPLSLNMRSVLDPDEFRAPGSGPSSATTVPNTRPTPDVAEDVDDLQIPGSLSQNILLQPPLPPFGPLFQTSSSPPESPPPPSPDTILSDPSDVSILSTRVPNTLYRRADELRQKAREEEILRARLEDQRKLAEADGRVMDALALKIKVREMDAEALKLHEKAARRYFVARNPLAKSHEIDVHGLRPREAFDRIERAIVKAHEEKRNIVRVIVGKGLHSVNQKPSLKPAVLREMQRQRIPCDVDARNPGVLIITLPTS